MSRQFPILGVVLAGIVLAAVGCTPQQPFYFGEDGDLSHYIGTATQIEYPDVESTPLDEVTGAAPPLTLDNPDPSEVWELTLEEAIRITLDNSKVIRALPQVGPGAPSSMPDYLIRGPAEAVTTVYDPALAETGSGLNAPLGVEAAMADYDADFDTSVLWRITDAPANVAGVGELFSATVRQEDVGSFQAQLRKKAATGGNWFLRHNVDYLWSNSPIRGEPSDWTTSLEAGFVQPLLKYNGVQVNRITGPPEFFLSEGGITAGSRAVPGFYRGVMIARINTDVTLADFEAQVRDLVDQVERAYWTLYLRYRTLRALTDGREKALETWRKVRAEFETGTSAAQDEAQARHQEFEFRVQVQEAQSQLFSAESNLRYIMGLAATDRRLIRPADEPSTAGVEFDFYEAINEALVRNTELRRQKWQIKRRELELIAAKNQLLPELNAGGMYRWRGLGDLLIDPDNQKSNSYGSMTSGDFQEWQLALTLGMTLGFRKELAEVRHAELNLMRDRAVLEDMELELSHQMSEALRDLSRYHQEAQTNYNKMIAAQDELNAWEAREREGLPVRDSALDRKLDAQRRVTTAAIDYYRSLTLYAVAIAQVHFRKGSLLEYNGVYLAEGPWPQKAYFDATRRARARDASVYLDYGFTCPKVISRGPYEQHAGLGGLIGGAAPLPEDVTPEVIPAPVPESFQDLSVPKPAPAEPSPESTGAMEQAEPAGVELRVAGGPGVKTGEVSRPRQAAGKYDLGSLDLANLGGEQAAAGLPPAPASPAVQPVSYQQLDAAARALKSAPDESGWRSAKTPSSRHEPVANPSTLEAPRDASGWKGVQR